MIDLNGLARQAAEDSDRRFRNGAFPENDTLTVLKHCATEVVEASAAYAHYLHAQMCGTRDFASELADIICCVLIIAGKEDIDIEKALSDCMERNRKRAEKQGDKL